MQKSWFRDCFHQVHMDFHIPEFPPEALDRLDVGAFVDQLQRAGVDLVALFAKCHFGNSYYQTRVGHIHRALKGDFLLEAAGECRRRGIRTLAYYSLCVDKHAYDENPDWRYRDETGQTYAGVFGSVCMNTPYKDELAMPQLEEIAAGYPVDGFFIDIPFPWGAKDYFCFCPSCRRRWKTEYGIEIDANLPAVERQRLNMRTAESWLLQIRELIDRRNPELLICSNIAGTAAVNRRIKELCDIGVWESQPRPGDYLGHSLATRLGRNDILDVQVMTVRFYEGWGDLSLKPEAQLTTECAAILGNGMRPCVGDQANLDGTLQEAVYDVLGTSFAFVSRYRPLLDRATTAPHTAVLLPTPDAELPFVAGAGARDPELNWKEMPAAWRGVHKMLVESHIHTDLFYSALETDLSRHPLIILPEPGSYSHKTLEQLRAYVAGGGKLLAVGESILQDGRAVLSDVFGIRYFEPLAFSTANFIPDERVKGETADLALQVRGQVFKVLADGAQPLARLVYPAGETQPPVKGFRHPCPPPARGASPFPFATLHTYGQGTAVYIAASIFAVYWRTNHHWLRQFVEAVIRFVDPEQPVQIDASGRIEANLMRCDDDLLLNLIHYSLGHQGGQNAIAGIERMEPVHEIRCRVRCNRVDAVVLEPENQELPFEHRDGLCTFVVPRIDHLAVVRLKGALRNSHSE
jgi:hypothetical protein